MAYQRIVALFVTDDDGYVRYREQMLPIMSEYGGSFRDDFRVSEVLVSRVAHPVNRVFIQEFPDSSACDRFFGDERYLRIRSAFFDPAVDGATVLAAFQVGTARAPGAAGTSARR